MTDQNTTDQHTEPAAVEPAAVVVEHAGPAPAAPAGDPKPADVEPSSSPDPAPAEEEEDTRLPLTEAMDVLTVAEVLTIERHFDRDLSKLSGTALTSAVAWAHERRRTLGQADRPDWAQINGWSMKRLNDYFAPEPVEIDEADPETTAGKDDTLAG